MGTFNKTTKKIYTQRALMLWSGDGGSVLSFISQEKNIAAKWLDSQTLEITHNKDIILTRNNKAYFYGDNVKYYTDRKVTGQSLLFSAVTKTTAVVTTAPLPECYIYFFTHFTHWLCIRQKAHIDRDLTNNYETIYHPSPGFVLPEPRIRLPEQCKPDAEGRHLPVWRQRR